MRQREEELAAIYTNAPIVMILVDRDRRVRKVNRAATVAAGRSAEEMIGLRGGEALHCVHHLDDPRGCGFGPFCQQCAVRRTVLETLATGEPRNQVEATIPVARSGGTEERTFLVSTSLLHLPEEPLVLVTLNDVTERKRTEESLRRSERELALINRIISIFLTIPNEDMYAEVLQVILETAGSKYGVFGYIDESGALVVPSMTRHIWEQCQVPDKRIVFPRETWGESIWPRAIRRKRTLYSNDRSALTPEGHVPVLRNISMPILHQGEVIGLLQVANKETDYNEEDVQSLEIIGRAIAPVLHARLQRDREERERRQAEEALRQLTAELEQRVAERTAELADSEARYRTLFEQAPDSVVLIDTTNGDLVAFNERAHENLGYTRAEFETLKISDLEVLESADEVARHLEKVLREGSDMFETRQRTKSGEIRDVHVSARAVTVGGKQYLQGVWHDHTAIKRAEESVRRLNADLERRAQELQAANQELEAFAYSVSHDLRSPLRGIDGYSRILLEDYHDQLDEDGRFVLGQVRASAQEMGVLIDDLLEFSRMGRREMHTATIDMAALFREVFGELQAAHPDRRLQFRIEPLSPTQGDRSMLREVARNLLGNAVKFTRPREVGEIEVGCRRDEGRGTRAEEPPPLAKGGTEGGSAIRHPPSAIVYFVRDNGVGFDMQYADKLFQVFQRLHRAEEFEGTGVGLALVKRIIDRHGGQVWAESERERGATFYFALPQ